MPAPLLLIAHPSPDVYGSDRQLLETVTGVRDAGWRVRVALPSDGPLSQLLKDRGAQVDIFEYPVLRKALLSPLGLLRLTANSPLALARLIRRIRKLHPDVVYVNTVTIPVWIFAARLSGVPVLVHVHEAEEDQPRLIRTVMAAPLLLAHEVVVNSAAAGRALTDVIGRLSRKITVVHNGIPAPPSPSPALRPRLVGDPAEIVLVGRLSPRKGIDVALEAVALLRDADREVRLTICGTVFAGYEWYEEQLRSRAQQPDLASAVTFAGYVHPTWPVLWQADIVLVPSRVEPFGNAAVEGLLARRPVVASDVQGLAEVIVRGRTGSLVRAQDARALAEAIAALLDDPRAAGEMAEAGYADAMLRFSLNRYHADMVAGVTRALRAKVG